MLPPLDHITRVTHVVQLPLATPFRGITTRQALLLQGPAGWAEFSPFLEYRTPEAATWLAATLDVAWHGLPPQQRTTIDVNATIPALPAHDVPDFITRFPGATTAKIKVAEPGQTLADDIARVRATRIALGDHAHLRIDANGGWTLTEAQQALTALAPYTLQYAEQPVAATHDLAQLTAWSAAHTGIRIAADEAIRKAMDPIDVADTRAADLAVLKMPPLGGPTRTLRIARYLNANGLDVVFSSALDTGIGLSAGLATAAALPHLPHANGLATWRLLQDDITDPPQHTQSQVTAPTTPAVPDPEKLDLYAADPATTAKWHQRLTECYHHLAANPLPEIPTP